MKRNRKKLKARAARWKALKSDSAESYALKLITGQTYAEFMGKGRAPVQGILSRESLDTPKRAR